MGLKVALLSLVGSGAIFFCFGRTIAKEAHVRLKQACLLIRGYIPERTVCVTRRQQLTIRRLWNPPADEAV